jgi:hypothetical protein
MGLHESLRYLENIALGGGSVSGSVRRAFDIGKFTSSLPSSVHPIKYENTYPLSQYIVVQGVLGHFPRHRFHHQFIPSQTCADISLRGLIAMYSAPAAQRQSLDMYKEVRLYDHEMLGFTAYPLDEVGPTLVSAAFHHESARISLMGSYTGIVADLSQRIGEEGLSLVITWQGASYVRDKPELFNSLGRWRKIMITRAAHLAEKHEGYRSNPYMVPIPRKAYGEIPGLMECIEILWAGFDINYSSHSGQQPLERWRRTILGAVMDLSLDWSRNTLGMDHNYPQILPDWTELAVAGSLNLEALADMPDEQIPLLENLVIQRRQIGMIHASMGDDNQLNVTVAIPLRPDRTTLRYLDVILPRIGITPRF